MFEDAVSVEIVMHRDGTNQPYYYSVVKFNNQDGILCTRKFVGTCMSQAYIRAKLFCEMLKQKDK